MHQKTLAKTSILLSRLFFVLVLALVSIPAFAITYSELPREATWVANGPVLAIARTATRIYLGGSFSVVGPYVGSGVPLDAATARPLAVYPKVNGWVSACIPDGKGGWFIGGAFDRVGSSARDRIAHILATGAVDPAWNPGADRTVCALALSGSTLYAGGAFTRIGGAGRNKLAALDAATGALAAWNPNVKSDDLDSVVESLAVSGTKVYAGGRFTAIGAQARANLAAIDTATGQAASWNPGADDTVYALAVSGSTIYAAGAFNRIGGQTRHRIAALSSGSNSAAGWNPNADGPVNALAVSGTKIYAAGLFTNIGGKTRNRIACLDSGSAQASSWNPNANCEVLSLAVSGSLVYAGGRFTAIGGQNRNGLAALDASTAVASAWNPNPSGAVNTLAVSGSAVYAGGSFEILGGLDRKCIACLDAATGAATAWNPQADAAVHDLAISGSTIYAGGRFATIGGQSRARIAELDLSSGLATPWNPGANGDVNALAISGTRLFVGGTFFTLAGRSGSSLAALDLGSGSPGAWACSRAYRVHDLLISDAGLFVASDAGVELYNPTDAAAKWSSPIAASFSAIPTVHSLAFSSGLLFAGGQFEQIGQSSRERAGLAALYPGSGNVASWNPAQYGSAFDVNALAVAGNGVYAGGFFWKMGGQLRDSLAAPDLATGLAASWNPSADSSVRVLNQSDSALCAGGDFMTIGGAGRPHFAQFDVASYNITFATDLTEGASLTGATRQSVAPGAGTTPVRAVAPPGCRFTHWTVSGANDSTANPLVLTNVRSDLVLTANFYRYNGVRDWYLFN